MVFFFLNEPDTTIRALFFYSKPGKEKFTHFIIWTITQNGMSEISKPQNYPSLLFQ